MRKNIFLAVGLMFLFSCAGQEEKANSHNHSDMQTAATEKEKFKEVKFDNQKDFACGMPVSAGVNDTTHYKGKVYGFCATECKDEFLKDPEGYLAGKK